MEFFDTMIKLSLFAIFSQALKPRNVLGSGRVLLQCFKFSFIIVVVTIFRGQFVMVSAITNDSMFSSIDLFIPSKEQNLHFILDRYLYYLIITIVQVILEILTNWQISSGIYWILIITTTPTLMNFLLDLSFMRRIRKRFYNLISNLSMIAICASSSWLINITCERILNISPAIGYDEFLVMIVENPINSLNLKVFLKSLVLASILHYVESTNVFYANVLRFIYHRRVTSAKTTSDAESLQKDKQKLIDVINSRSWSRICSAEILQIIVRIYKSSNNRFVYRKINEIATLLEIQTAKFFAIYTIAALFEVPQLISALSLILLLISRRQNLTIYQIILRVLMFTTSFYFPIAVCSSLEYFELLENSVVKLALSKIISYTRAKYHLLFQVNTYNRDLLCSLAILALIRYFDIHPIVNLFCLLASRNNCVFGLMIACGFFSEYSPTHLSFCSVVFYLIINLYNLSTKTSEITTDLIDSYTREANALTEEDFEKIQFEALSEFTMISDSA